MSNIVDFENLDKKLSDIILSNNFIKLQKYFNKAKHIFYIGNGGNLAIADHAAIDTSRLTDKNVKAPGSGILVSSIIADTNFPVWLENWILMQTRGLKSSECLVLGFSCSTSGESSNALLNAIKFANKKKIPTALISAQVKEDLPKITIPIIQNVVFYHTSEIISMALTYQLIHGAGFKCPSIAQKASSRKFNKLGINEKELISNEHFPPNFDHEKNNIAIDFDGVLHNFNKGWYDGTCYGDPIKGSLEAVKKIAKKYKIIIFSSKVRPDRPLVRGKNGYQLVKEWLKKHGYSKYISEITHEKPRANYYIDDKAVLYDGDWKKVLGQVKVK